MFITVKPHVLAFSFSLLTVAACSKPAPPEDLNRAYVLLFDGIDGAGEAAASIRAKLSTHPDLHTVAWRNGSCYCFLLSDSIVSERLQQDLVGRLGGAWTPSKIDYLPSTTLLGTASGTKSGTRIR